MMNRLSHTIVYGMLGAALTCALSISCTRDDLGAAPGRTAVEFNTNIATRTTGGGDQWAASDRVGIFMVNTAGALPAGIASGADNRRFMPSAAGSSAALLPADASQTIYYPLAGKVDFVAYYPWRTAPSADPYKYKVSTADQTDPAAIDLLWTRADNAGAGYAKTEAPVELRFDHKLSKLTLNVVRGNGMAGVDFSTMTVSFSGMPTTADFGLTDGSMANPAGTAASFAPLTVTEGETYQAIVIPQASGTGRKVAFTIGGGTYTWEIPDATTFAAGLHYTYTITVHKPLVEISPATIADWADGGTQTGQVLPLETQMLFDWAGHGGIITAVEMTGGDGVTYLSGVDPATNRTTGLYNRPASITALKLYFAGRTTALTLAAGYYSGDPAEGIITITGGDGSAGLPRLVALPADLAAANSGGLGLNYIQVRDIDFGGATAPWTPIGSDVNPFTGVYDGGGYTIDNMAVNGDNYLGLFGYSTGVLKNINLGAGCSVTGTGGRIGGVCGTNDGAGGRIENCTNAGTVYGTGSSYSIGGICGGNTGGATVTGCANTGAVESSGANIGGVCGYNAGSTATVGNCTNAATVTTTSTGENRLGGICGFNSSGTVTGGTNTGAVTGSGYNIGGVCGLLEASTITACYTTGKVTGASNVYHLASIYSGTVRHCYWTAPAGDNATASSNDTSKETGCFQFGNGIVAGTGWPAENAANGWGLYSGDGTTPPAAGSGLYWKSLGSWNGGNSVYPKLWWQK